MTIPVLREKFRREGAFLQISAGEFLALFHLLANAILLPYCVAVDEFLLLWEVALTLATQQRLEGAFIVQLCNLLLMLLIDIPA